MTYTLKMLGKTITSHNYNKEKESVIFEFSDGTAAIMRHKQDCCESVNLEEIIGDLNDLVGNPLLTAELRTSTDNPKDPENTYTTHTWSFYEFATIKGSVTLRWYGESNGYYSETVDIYYYASVGLIEKDKDKWSPSLHTAQDYGYEADNKSV